MFVNDIHRMSSCCLSTIYNINTEGAKHIVLANIPTPPAPPPPPPPPPDPLTALLEIFVRLLPNHVYPGMIMVSLFLKNVSHGQSRSSSVARIILSQSLQ